MFKPTEKIINEITQICKQHKCKIILSKKSCDDDGSAAYIIKTGTIFIYMKNINNKRHFINTFFHELGHHYCAINNIWVSFHHFHKNAKYTWLKAEKWVDRWAAKEFKKHYPKLNYSYLYSDAESIEWSRDYYKRAEII